MGFKRVLLERSLKTEDLFPSQYRTMDYPENLNLKLIRDGIQAAAAAAGVGGAGESMKQFSDFSIDKILNSGSSNASSDNEESVDYRALQRTGGRKAVDLTSQIASPTATSTSPSCEPLRPLNRVLESPWNFKGPVMFTPKINALHSNYYESISQTLITVHQSAQNYPFAAARGLSIPHPGGGGGALLNPHLFYHSSAAAAAINRASGVNGGLLKSDNGDLIMPPTSLAVRDLDYCYMPTPSSAAAAATAVALRSSVATTTPPQMPSNESTSSSSPAYNCPCKQCELRSLSLNSVAPSVEEETATAAAAAAALFNLKSRYECEECGKGFSQLRNYKYHLSIHKGTREFAAHCPECGKMFNDKGYLSSHLKIHRNRKEYVCPHCPKSFNQRVAFNMHVRIHTGIKPHTCPQCSKRFSRKMLLKQHLRTHTGEKPYQCTICSKTFADRSNMTLHQRLHSGEMGNLKKFCWKYSKLQISLHRNKTLLLSNLPKSVHQKAPPENSPQLPHGLQTVQMPAQELWPVLHSIFEYADSREKVSIQTSRVVILRFSVGG